MSAPTTNVFTVTVTGEWKDGYLPTTRHRKLRYRDVEESVNVDVRSVTSAEAPVAFTVDGKPIRLYDGRLYTQRSVRKDELFVAVIPGSSDFPADQRAPGYRAYADRAAFLAAADQVALSVIINGTVWDRTGEPCYTVNTFGLGGNHGGTGLSPDCSSRLGLQVQNVFRADDYDAAVDYATKVALGRGDTDSVNHFMPRIVVHLPEAVTLRIPREHADAAKLRDDHQSAVRQYRDLLNHGPAAEESAAWQKVLDTRKQLLAVAASACVPEAVAESAYTAA
ncbi:hypothetical protein ACFQNE_03160 [Gordonia phosphorivorans]|uniref:Uncharacterized protein n=1 Tax=Gordonia phosphorivorans TaxID=1056982 RepID=A0ABV6H6F8_9ACTN